MERLEERFKKLYEGGNDILPKLKRELEGLQDYLSLGSISLPPSYNF